MWRHVTTCTLITGGSRICILGPTRWPVMQVIQGQIYISIFMSQIYVQIISPIFTLAHMCYVMHTYTKHAHYLGQRRAIQTSRGGVATPSHPVEPSSRQCRVVLICNMCGFKPVNIVCESAIKVTTKFLRRTRSTALTLTSTLN